MLYYNNQIDDAFFTSGLSPCTGACTTVTGRAVDPGGDRLHFQCPRYPAMDDGLFEGLQRYFQKNPPANSYVAWQQAQKMSQA